MAVTAFFFKDTAEGTGGVDVSEVREFLRRAMADRPRTTRGYDFADSWKMTVKTTNGTQMVLGLTLRADGTVLMQGLQDWEGTWTYTGGHFSLAVPGLGISETTPVTWDDDNRIHWLSGGNEVILERR